MRYINSLLLTYLLTYYLLQAHHKSLQKIHLTEYGLSIKNGLVKWKLWLPDFKAIYKLALLLDFRKNNVKIPY